MFGKGNDGLRDPLGMKVPQKQPDRPIKATQINQQSQLADLCFSLVPALLASFCVFCAFTRPVLLNGRALFSLCAPPLLSVFARKKIASNELFQSILFAAYVRGVPFVRPSLLVPSRTDPAALAAITKARDSRTLAVYDGKQLVLNGEALTSKQAGIVGKPGQLHEKRKLVTHIIVLPGVKQLSQDTQTRKDGYTSLVTGAFQGCTKLSSVLLPEGLVKIGCSSFRDCISLSSINFPDSVQSIGTKAFMNCRSLPSVILSKELKQIDEEAFLGCTALASVTLPKGFIEADKIGRDAFMNCGFYKLSLAAGFGGRPTPYILYFSRRLHCRYAVLASLARRLLLSDGPEEEEEGEEEEEEKKEEKEEKGEEEKMPVELKKLIRRAFKYDPFGDGDEEESSDEEEDDVEDRFRASHKKIKGRLAFNVITSSDLWRHILEFV